MKVTSDIYVPALKWRMAEYQALSRLSEAAKERVIPLLTIPSLEFDFEDQKPKKTVQAHIEPFAKRYKEKWKKRAAWVDIDGSLHLEKMVDGLDVITHVFSELRKFGAQAVPVISLAHSSGPTAKIAKIVEQDGRGVALRVRVENIMASDFGTRVSLLLGQLKVDQTFTDLILDLGTPNYEPYSAFSGALKMALSKIPNLGAYRSFVLLGTAFPESMKNVVVPGAALDRHDWLFYKMLIANLPESVRRPAYGDYTVVSPIFSANFDMRKIKPAGKLIYTSNERWVIRKGGAFRDNPGQMHKHCAYIVDSGAFRGAAYSDGDDFIARCAEKKIKPSSLPRWKQVGISHHIMHVLEDIATLGA